ncbi:MAG: mechanosensitive ion channel domain-containing protein [Methylobacter sp.]
MTNKLNALRRSIASPLSNYRREMHLLAAVALLLSAFSATFEVWAQPAMPLPKVQAEKDETTKKVPSGKEIPIKEQLAAVQGRLVEVWKEMAIIEIQTKLPAGATTEEADEYKSLQERLIQLYELQIRALEQMQTIDASADELRQQMASWTGFAVKPPYPLDLGDDLWREIRTVEQEIQTLHIALLVFEKDLSDAKELLKPAASAMQQSAERLNELKPGEERARPRWLLDLNQLRSRVAEVEIATQETNRRMVNTRITAKEAERVFLSRKLDEADAHIHFSQEELNAKIDKLNQEQLSLQKEIELAKHNDQAIYQELSPVQKRLNQLRQKEQGSPGLAAEMAEEILRQEQSANLLVARMEAVAYQRRALLEMERVIDRAKAVWKERFALMNSSGAASLTTSLNSLQAEQAQFEQKREILLSIQEAVQNKLAYQQSQQKDPTLAAADREQSHKLAEAYLQQINAWVPLQARLAKFGDLLERTTQEAERRRANLSLKERAKNLLAMVVETVRQLTSFEIYSVTDTITVEGEEISGTRRVTLGEMLQFLLIITVGFWLAAQAVNISQRGAKYLFRMNVDSAALFARLGHILLSIGVVMAALTTMKIPITVFAFLGGALALAFGFGAQNLLNNFVSGLILLIERPVKTGDIVDVEGVSGRITQIGARCCQIRRFDGIEMLVPNSAMIEKTVTNWTLSDHRRRASVTIGIAYGSPIEQAQDLIESAVRAHPEVLSDPCPVVLFEDFGESALIFTVYYWLDLARVADRMVVASEIRVSLNRRLNEAGIIIAYPQRDVHLHSVQPLEVAIANPVASESDSGSRV